WIARWLARYNKQHAHAVRDRAFERIVEIGMCADQIMPVKIDTSFRPDEPPPEPAIPAAIERVGRRGRRSGFDSNFLIQRAGGVFCRDRDNAGLLWD